MADEVTVASWNIHKGVGTDGRRDLSRTTEVIGQIGADIIALQEVDTRFGTRTGLLNLDRLRLDHGLVPVPVGPGPAHGWHGNLILVRDARVHEVRRIALPGLEPRGALMADLTMRGAMLRVIGAHLGLLPASRAAQTKLLVEMVLEMETRPTVLMGDLNEWRAGKGKALAHLSRHFARSESVASFPSRAPFLPLDRIMACMRAEVHDLQVHATPLARVASDHLPIKAQLRF